MERGRGYYLKTLSVPLQLLHTPLHSTFLLYTPLVVIVAIFGYPCVICRPVAFIASLHSYPLPLTY